ncbi:MAG: TolC family protein, partial [Acidobacteriota bacterium]
MTIPTRRSYPNRRGRRSRRRAASWVLAASLALAPQALADGSALSLTLEQVLALARERSPRIEQRAALLRGAEAEARRARAGRAPEIDAHASYRHLSDVPDVALTFADGQRRTIFPNITERYQGRVDLAVPLYTAGRIRNTIVAAQRGREAAAHELRLERSDLELEVTVAYWQLAVAREREQVLRQSIASFAAHLTDARHRLQYGLAARNELLSIQVERDAAELDRLEAANAAAIAEANLLRLLDLEPHTRLETADPLGPAPPRAKAGGAEVAELEQLVTQALSSRSERAALEARWAVARATIEAERGSRRPQVSASAGFQYARPNPRVLPLVDQFDDSWDVGLAVS